jgi:hypothetical protein
MGVLDLLGGQVSVLSKGDAGSVDFAVRKSQRPPAVTLESSFCEVKERVVAQRQCSSHWIL